MKIHTSLAVTNIERTSAFYSILFDTEAAKTKVDYVKFEPKTLALNISFHKKSTDQIINTDHHLGIQFPTQNDLDIAYQRLSQAGLISKEKESTICCYADQDKFWVQDPDGYQWELYYLLEDTEIKIDEHTNCCADKKTENNTNKHEKNACC